MNRPRGSKRGDAGGKNSPREESELWPLLLVAAFALCPQAGVFFFLSFFFLFFSWRTCFRCSTTTSFSSVTSRDKRWIGEAKGGEKKEEDDEQEEILQKEMSVREREGYQSSYLTISLTLPLRKRERGD